MKKTLVMVAVLSILCAFGVYAGEGCSHSKGGAKKGGCCPGMDATFKSLQSDLAQMEKGVKPADQDAFLKAHQENLKKLVDMHAKMADEMKGDKKGDKKGEMKGCAAHQETMTAAFKANQADLEKMGKPMTDTEKTDFFKTHQANLKTLLDTKSECEKSCKAKGGHKKGADKKADDK